MPRSNHRTPIDRAPNLPPFAALRAFEALVSLGGIRRAAQHLGVHYSVVSRHVMRLNGWLGVPLLTWSQNQFTLTPEGEQFYGRIAAALSEIADATSEITEPANHRPMRIWCSPGLSTQWLAGQLADFERLHPHFRVEIKPSDVPADLRAHEGEANIYLRLDNDRDKRDGQGLKALDLVRPVAMLAVSPALDSQLPDIDSPADLLTLPLLHGNQRDEWRLWFGLQGVELPGEPPGELCWNHHMALEAARLGRGILLANRVFFERDLVRGELVELRVAGARRVSIGRYNFVAREDRWSTPALATFRTFIATRLQSVDWHWKMS